MNNNENIQTSQTERKISEMLTIFRSTNPVFGYSMVSKNELVSQLEEVLTMAKKEFEDSEQIKAMRNEILSEAKYEADEIVRRTREEIEKQDMIQQAHEYARNIAMDAEKKADNMILDAEEYKQTLMREGFVFVDQLMQDALETLSENKNALSSAQEQLMESRNQLQDRIKTELTKMRDENQASDSNQRFA